MGQGKFSDTSLNQPLLPQAFQDSNAFTMRDTDLVKRIFSALRNKLEDEQLTCDRALPGASQPGCQESATRSERKYEKEDHAGKGCNWACRCHIQGDGQIEASD